MSTCVYIYMCICIYIYIYIMYVALISLNPGFICKRNLFINRCKGFEEDLRM